MCRGRYDAGSVPGRMRIASLQPAIRNGHQFIIKAIFAIIVCFCAGGTDLKNTLLAVMKIKTKIETKEDIY